MTNMTKNCHDKMSLQNITENLFNETSNQSKISCISYVFIYATVIRISENFRSEKILCLNEGLNAGLSLCG